MLYLDSLCLNPANMRCWPNVALLLGQRRRQWASSKPTLGQRLVFAGNPLTAELYNFVVTHLKFCLATANHNFNWVKITHIC